MMIPSLLYVDDEPENLKTFVRVFKKDFKILTEESGEAGLETFKKNPELSLIVSDQRMPGMSGVDFLNACKLINPDPVRILITGYADLESTINAINEAEIYRFIKKPWERLDLLQTLKEAQRRFELENEVKSLARLKDKFMMLVNHELKTPLTVLRSYLDFLSESSLDEEQKLYILKSIEGSERLEGLIAEILYFLEIQKKDINTDQEGFELSEATGLQDLKGTRIKTNKVLFCDAIKRLIENAETHKKDETRVQIEVLSENKLKISNEHNHDTGLNTNLILQPFEINENAFNHSKGLGLGLAISSLVLNKLGFLVKVDADEKFFNVVVDLSEKLDN